MAKLTLADLASLSNQTSAIALINANNALIETALENTLSRDGTTPNSMGADLDMNSNQILNLPAAVGDTEPIRKAEFDDYTESVAGLVSDAEAARDAAQAAETAAVGAASSASGSATAAAASVVAAAALLDNFDDKYLGAFNSDPVVDNDGNPLVTGQLYFNQVSNQLYIWTGTTWNAQLGTDTVSTLTNKTITLSANTITGTLAQFNTALTDDNFVSLTGAETLTNKTLTSANVTTDIRPTTNDEASLGISGTAFSDLFLASGAVINFNAGNATITHSAGALTYNVPITANSLTVTSATVPANGIYLPAASTLGFAVSAVAEMRLTSAALSPAANSGNALGTTALSWAGLFLATGTTINFAASNVVLTHSTGVLNMTTGDLRVTTAGSDAASVVLVGGAQTLTNKTLTSPVISTISNTGVLTLPTATTTLVGRDTTDILTNKTINLTSNTLVATSLQLLTAVTDETGTGQLVFATSPTLVTPLLGTPTSGVLTNCTGLPTTGLVNAAVTNAKLADVPTATFKGRTTAGTGVPEDLTATQATALLNNLVGDSGAGGTKGLAPAPGAGTAAAGFFLKADGTWAAPPGGGAVAITEVTIDFGSTGKYNTTEDFVVLGVTAGQKIHASMSLNMPSGVQEDEFEMDPIIVVARGHATDTIRVSATSVSGRIVGERNVNLILG